MTMGALMKHLLENISFPKAALTREEISRFSIIERGAFSGTEAFLLVDDASAIKIKIFQC